MSEVLIHTCIALSEVLIFFELSQMKRLLDMNGVVYKQVSLQSAYLASVSVTFQVDLEEGDQSENITQLGMFLGDPERFSSFSDYNVMEDGRGVVDISVAGIVISIYNYMSNGCMLTISVYYNPLYGIMETNNRFMGH